MLESKSIFKVQFLYPCLDFLDNSRNCGEVFSSRITEDLHWATYSEAVRKDGRITALGTLGAEPIRMLRGLIGEFDGACLCSLIGGGKTAPEYRLNDLTPVRKRGFDHATQGPYAVAAAVPKALGLDRSKTADAIFICGTTS